LKDNIIDVLIIGAGPSGCVAASYLHNNNVTIKVVEKNKFPRFVIGESLLPRCMDHFEEVGLLQVLTDFGFEKKEGARFIKENLVCEFDFSKKHTEGWNWTWQVPRADFDNVLAQELVKRGVDIAFEHEVIDVSFDENGISTTTINDENGVPYTVTAKNIIDSSGYGRVLPRLLDLSIPSKLPKHSSIFTHVDDTKRPEGYEGTRITFDVLDTESWLWVIPFSNGKTSIGYVGPTAHLESFSGNTTEKLQAMVRQSHFFKDRFDAIDYLFEPPFIKNYSVSVKQLFGKGYVLTGNSTEFLDPVFSSGVAFATESALLAAKLITKKDSYYIEATLTNAKNEPVKDAELKVQLQRLFAPLAVGKEIYFTDENGIINVPITEKMPGVNGKLNYEVVLDDSDAFGTIKSILPTNIGKPIKDLSTFDQRTMWSPPSKAPWFNIIIPNLLILGIWGYLVVLVVNLYRISKHKNS